MGLQKGGYKLKKSIRDTLRDDVDVFTLYILPMIRHEGTIFEILNTDSLYGFVVVMKVVDISISKFVNDDDEPVNEFVIKICELHSPNTKCSRTLRKPGELFKKSLSYDMFLRESETQQKIWSERLEMGLQPICPAFTSSKIIDHRELIQELVERLFQSDGNIVSYLKSEIVSNSYDLGFMMMEKIEGVTLKSVSGLYDSTARFICAASITLFLKHDVINTDMNQGNCILNQITGEITMIDFGLVMTPKYLIECINSRGDTLRTTSPDNTFLIRQLKDNLVEIQKLQLFFHTAHDKYGNIDSEETVASILTFLAHMESRFLLLQYGALANSNMKQLVEHALRGDRAYENILDIYRSLNQPVKPPGTPLKESMKVGYEPRVVSVERPQEYFLTDTPLLMRKVNADYESMWIPSKPGKALPSARELVHAVELMEAKLSDDDAFQNAMKMGTPDSCFPVSERGASSGHSLSYELPGSEEEEEEEDSFSESISANDSDVLVPFQFEPQQYNSPSPHLGSTPRDNSAEFLDYAPIQHNPPSPHFGSTPMDNPDEFLDYAPIQAVPQMDVRVIEQATRPDKKRGNDEYLVNPATGATRFSGGRRHKITKRKRITAKQVLKKRKTRKQRKQKTRKIYKKTYNKKNI